MTEVPLAYINRNPLLLGISALLSLALVYYNYQLLKDLNPWGFLLLIVTTFMSFHSLWLLLNPFAAIYKDRFEIRQTLFHNKPRYYLDIQKIGFNRQKQLILVYNDDESERIHLFGIQKNKENELKEKLEKLISELPRV